MHYKFDTQYFAVTDESILFLRNRYPYREIKPLELKHLEFTKGTDVKRPALSILFGVILVSASVYLILNFSGFKPSDISGGRIASRTFGYLIILEFILLFLGGYSIYKTLPIHSVIKFTMVSGETESISIDEVIKNKTTDTLLKVLKETFGSDKILIDRELGV